MVALLRLGPDAHASAATGSMVVRTPGRKLKVYWLLPGSFLTIGERLAVPGP